GEGASGARFFRAVLAERDHGPAARGGVRAERRVRIDRHGVRDALEERQVVQRIAVEPALVIVEAAAAAREPLLDAPDLPLPEAGRAPGLPGEGPVHFLDVRRDEVLDPELARDGLGDEAV